MHCFDFILVTQNEPDSATFGQRIKNLKDQMTKFVVIDGTGQFCTSNWGTVKQHMDQIITVNCPTKSTSPPTPSNLMMLLNDGTKRAVREIMTSDLQEYDVIILSQVDYLLPGEAVTQLRSMIPEEFDSPRGLYCGQDLVAVALPISQLLQYPQPSDLFKTRVVPLDYSTPAKSEPPESEPPKSEPPKSEPPKSEPADSAPVLSLDPDSLEYIFRHQLKHGSTKMLHYFAIYEHFLQRFWTEDPIKKPVILEIGVGAGGSLELWSTYFSNRGGSGCEVWGFDIDERCRKLERHDIHIIIGDQANPNDLTDLMQRMPAPDIIIDDGGHHAIQKTTTFKTLFPYLKPNGIYFSEQLQSCYLDHYEGGLGQPGTMIEEAKHCIDQMNTKISSSSSYHKNNATFAAIHFYPNLLVVEKTTTTTTSTTTTTTITEPQM